MNKFWDFEKKTLVNFFADRQEQNIEHFLEKEEMAAINRDLRYGTLEYLSDSLSFRPNKNEANTIEATLFLANENPKSILKKFLHQIRTPYVIAVDFWCIGNSTSKGLQVIYPSFGTALNKQQYIKYDEQVSELLDVLETGDLKKKIYDAHARSRDSIQKSGVNIEHVLSMWIRLMKVKPVFAASVNAANEAANDAAK